MTPKDIIATMERLRKADRLGIHVLEEFKDTVLGLPKEPLASLRETDMSDVLKGLPQYERFGNKVQLHSISFVPNGVKIRPWGAGEGKPISPPLYFLNLVQTTATESARIVVASEENLTTGIRPTEKEIKTLSKLPRLLELNEPPEETNLQAAAQPRTGIIRGANMLEALVDHYADASDYSETRAFLGEINAWKNNELLAAFSMQHVMGIGAVMLFSNERHPLFSEAVAVLNGVSIYFQHRERGVELPLFSYDLHQSADQLITPLAMNEVEARIIAERASEQIERLVKEGFVKRDSWNLMDLKRLKERCTPFGIDMFMPEANMLPEEPKPHSSPLGAREIDRPVNQAGPWQSGAEEQAKNRYDEAKR